jgi:hypothetical protein
VFRVGDRGGVAVACGPAGGRRPEVVHRQQPLDGHHLTGGQARGQHGDVGGLPQRLRERPLRTLLEADRPGGRAEEDLLDTYHAERHPAGAWVLHITQAQRALAHPQPGPDIVELREVLTELLRLPEANRHMAGLMSGLSQPWPLAADDRRVPAPGA